MSIPESHQPLNRLSLYYVALTFLSGGTFALAAALELSLLAVVSFVFAAVGVFSGGALTLFLFVRNVSWLRDWRRVPRGDATSVVDDVPLNTILRILLGIAAAVILYMSSFLLFAEDRPDDGAMRSTSIVLFVLGGGMAALTILGPRSSLFSSLIAAASASLTRTKG